MNKEKESVCAVVVTYNRKELLIECLEALRKQVRPIQGIYLIDNASTDGTPDLLLEKGYLGKLPPENLTEPWEKEFKIENLTDGKSIKLHYVRMHENTGGAGGFHEGVKRAYEKKYDWLWLMDDDTIVDKNSINELLNAVTLLQQKNIKPGFLCSKVLWIDRNPHLMNLPSIKPIVNKVPFNQFEDEGLIVVEAASFVSLLVHREIVSNVGLPIKEFFIWGDDVEFTLRITRRVNWGIYVKKSIVYHKTRVNYTAMDVNDWRVYYYIRNNLYICKKYNKKKYFFLLLWNLINFLFKKKKLSVIRGCLDSLIFDPKIELVK